MSMKMIYEKFKEIGEYVAAGMYEDTDRGLFYRKAMGLKRFYENCPLGKYEKKSLYPSGYIENNIAVFPTYLNGIDLDYTSLAEKDKNLADVFVSDFKKFCSSVPQEHAVGGNMYCHSLPNYERILKEGLLSYTDRINKIKDSDIRGGLIQLLDGIKIYIKRCVDYLKSVDADEELIRALEKVPLYPAENIYEAIVAWNFIMYLDGCDNLGCLASGLNPYYKGENIINLLENLYDNFNANGRGTVETNGGWSMALNTDCTSLTLQCLEAAKNRRRPMIELLVNDDTPDEIWDKAFEVIRTCGGQPAFYNEKAIMKGLKKRFPKIINEDLKRFCGVGCTETSISGMSNIGSTDAGINLPLILESVINTKLKKSDSFEDFYNQYIDEVRAVVNHVTDEISNSQKMRALYNPLPMRTLLVDDCIDNGKDFNNGGARYKWSICNFAGLINVIDSMLVIKNFVFDKKLFNAEEVIQNLNSGNQEFLELCKKCDIHFGTDDDTANAFSHRISSDIYSMLDNKKSCLGEGFLPASIQFLSQVEAGKDVGATPDGRNKGEPLCDSLGAVFGKDTEGPTALLKSVSSLALDKALGTPVLNFNINPEFENNILKALIWGYMHLGGIQMQITCTSAEMLEKAYEKPEDYKNLVVRVGGFSEYFCRLSDELKRMIINRTIHNARNF